MESQHRKLKIKNVLFCFCAVRKVDHQTTRETTTHGTLCNHIKLLGILGIKLKHSSCSWTTNKMNLRKCSSKQNEKESMWSGKSWRKRKRWLVFTLCKWGIQWLKEFHQSSLGNVPTLVSIAQPLKSRNADCCVKSSWTEKETISHIRKKNISFNFSLFCNVWKRLKSWVGNTFWRRRERRNREIERK